MAVTTPPSIDVLPTAPSNAQPVSFATTADAYFAAIPNYRAQLVALGANVFSNATDAASSASNALSSASVAAISAAQAINATNAPAWVSGQAYAQYTPVVSPTDFRVYRRRTAGSGTVDPAADPTNWASPLATAAPFIHARETQPSGTSSTISPPVAAAYTARALNGTVGGISIPGAALSAGGVILPSGIYEFDGDACAQAFTGFQIVSRLSLFNITDGADIVVGPSVSIVSNANTPTSVRGRFTLAATKTIGLRQWFQASAPNGQVSSGGGQAINNGQIEVYASLLIKQIG